MESEASQQTILQAAQWLEQNRAAEAEQTLVELLNSEPNNRQARRLLGFAQLQQNNAANAVEIFTQLFAVTQQDPVCALDYAAALKANRQLEEAAAVLQGAVVKVPTLSPGWYLLGDVFVEGRKFDLAQKAYQSAQTNDPFRLQIDQTIRSIHENDPEKSRRIFLHILEQDPLHAEALAGMAMLALADEAWIEAERCFNLALKRTRYWPKLLLGFAQLFLTTVRFTEARQTLMTLAEIEPRSEMTWNMLGTACEQLMRYDEAIAAFRNSLRLNPNQPRAYVSIGNIERVFGNRELSEQSFKKATQFAGHSGEAWWGLSNLKAYVFSDAEVEQMCKSLRRDSTSLHHAAPLYFAVAKAMEDRQQYDDAFEYYLKGNSIQKAQSGFSTSTYLSEVHRIKTLFDRNFLNREYGACQNELIFIIGLPRTGSTLVEQILSAHSQVDATMELPFIPQLIREINARADDIGPYPESLDRLASMDFERLAERYLNLAEPYRQGAPIFIDKLPNNFVHIGFINRLFPNARFIDVRRHPLDTCVSLFKQRFATGQAFSYSLEDIGYYLVGYYDLMDHWRSVLRDEVYTLHYEKLVKNPETEIQRLLDFCGLVTEAACFTPEKNDRAIRTPSSEQVRQPISANRVDYWRNFEAYLDVPKKLLEPILIQYPPY